MRVQTDKKHGTPTHSTVGILACLLGITGVTRPFCQKTHSKRISNMVFFQHHYIIQSAVTPEDQIIKAVSNLKSAL
jgi:hypothetical protein